MFTLLPHFESGLTLIELEARSMASEVRMLLRGETVVQGSAIVGDKWINGCGVDSCRNDNWHVGSDYASNRQQF